MSVCGRVYFADQPPYGQFTISDVTGALYDLFFWPGDFALSLLWKIDGLGRFFESGCPPYGGWIATIVSLIVWSYALAILRAVMD